jgi:hypothetical protein
MVDHPALSIEGSPLESLQKLLPFFQENDPIAKLTAPEVRAQACLEFLW